MENLQNLAIRVAPPVQEGTRMNYNHLYYFHVIAQEGSIAKASKRLHVSQPTISEQLKQLEAYFGVKFFDRKSGTLRLNQQGQKALDYTQVIFETSARLMEAFESAPEPVKIHLEIGVVTTATRSVATDKLGEILRDQETVARIRQGDHQYLLHELVSSGLDILITDTMPTQAHQKGVESRVMKSQRMILIAGEEFAAKLTEPFPKAAHRQPFINYTSQSLYRWEIDQFFRNNQVEPMISAETDDVYLVLHAVADGICLGVVPESVLEEYSGKQKLVELGEIPARPELYLIYNRKDPSEQVLNALNVLAEE